MRNEEENYTFTQWLETHQSSTTRSSYHSALTKFLRSVYQTDQAVEALASRYIKEVKANRRDFRRDLENFVIYSQDAKRNGKVMPPNSLELYLAATYGFLSDCCNIEVSARIKRSIRNKAPKGSRARTIEDDLTREKIRKILLHADVRIKALLLFLLSSGVRVGEALQLKLDDITLEASPAVVHIRGEYAKEGDAYTSFISDEAKEALAEWLKIRKQYIIENAYRLSNAKERKYRPWRKDEVHRNNPLASVSVTLTPAQMKLYEALKEEGINVVYEYPVGRSPVDLAIPSAKLAVEIDGMAHLSLGRRIQDAAKERFLTSRGWRVLRFTNEQVWKSTDNVTSSIMKAIS